MKNFCTLLAALLAFSATAVAKHSEESDDDILENTVDLQWSVCDSGSKTVLAKIDPDDLKEKETTNITYYDTATGRNLQLGLTVRLKASSSENEIAVKVRFNKKTTVPGANCSWDRYGESVNFTCELSVEAERGSAPWSGKLLNFVRSRYPTMDFSELQAFGPYENRKWRFHYKGFKVNFDKVDAGGSAGKLMEFSLKAPESRADELYGSFTAFLEKKGVVLCRRQESKTARLFQALGIAN
jgi:hypothetical protein